MVRRWLFTVVLAFILAHCTTALSQGQPQEENVIKGVYRFVGAGTYNFPINNRPHQRPGITVAPPDGGPNIDITLAVDDKNKMDPTHIKGADLLKDLKRGDLVSLAAGKNYNVLWLSGVIRYELQPGEDEPNVYEFVKSSAPKAGDKDERPLVTLRRFLRETEVAVPTVKNPEGKMIADEKIAKIVETLKPGDHVEVTAAGTPPTIKGIKVWEAPKQAEFVKLTKAKTDKQEVDAVELKIDNSSQTLMIDAKDAPRLMGILRSFKAGGKVLYKGTTGDKGTWLTSIKAVP